MTREMVGMWGKKMGVKGMTLRAEKQNPGFTCTLTFLNKIHTNFSFQIDGIKTHFHAHASFSKK